MNRMISVALALGTVVMSTGIALAQYGEALPPRFNRSGSAVCPLGYDYVQPYCVPQRRRGYGGGGYGGGGYRRGYGGGSETVPARFNRSGSAVCPDQFDYIAGACRSRY